MEEKKRRPRLKTDTDAPLEERNESTQSKESSENQSSPIERKPWEDRSQSGERKPLEDRSGGQGGERKPWQDRSQGGERKPWEDRSGGQGGERRPYQDRSQSGERKPWEDRSGGQGGERKPWQDRSQGGERKPWEDRSGGQGGERKPWQDRSQVGERKPWEDRSGGQGGERRPYQDRGQGGERKPWEDRSGGQGGERRPYQDRSQGGERKPWEDRSGGQGGERRPYQDRSQGGERKPWQKSGGFGNKSFGKKPFRKKDDFHVERKPKPGLPSGEGMPLNKYLAHCGIASRRKSVDYINDEKVLVNGVVQTEPFYRIQPGDIVICDGQTMSIQERQVYVLLNKPKNVITTTEDDHGRATVLDMVDGSFPERLFPVGRLDRDTTGLIVITNDGDLAQRLTHPSYAVHKQYRVGLRSSLKQSDLEHIERGVELEDGLMEINWIRFSEDHPNRDIVELEITSGRNRIVRRLFEHLGYEVFKLDRFYFAGLTKKDLPRGSFRELTQREVIMLKHFTGHPSTGKKRKKDEEGDVDDMEDDIDLPMDDDINFPEDTADDSAEKE